MRRLVPEATGPKDEEFGAERTQAIIGRSAEYIAAAAQQFGQNGMSFDGGVPEFNDRDCVAFGEPSATVGVGWLWP